MNDAKSSRSGSLLVSEQFLAFGLEMSLVLCPDQLGLPMEYLQL